MNNFIKLTSMTEAIKSKNILYRNGINSYVKKYSGNNSSRGCTFGIFVPYKFNKAVEVLEKNGINCSGRAFGDNNDIS